MKYVRNMISILSLYMILVIYLMICNWGIKYINLLLNSIEILKWAFSSVIKHNLLSHLSQLFQLYVLYHIISVKGKKKGFRKSNDVGDKYQIQNTRIT